MRLPLAILLVVAAASCALADVIHQPGGGRIVGEIVKESEEAVTIKTRGGGVLEIPRDEIDRIERGPVSPVPVPVPVPVPPSPSPSAIPVTRSSEPARSRSPESGTGTGTVTGTTKMESLGIDEI